MLVPPRTHRQIGRQRLPRSTAGLSLVELMIVVLIISVLFMAAVPAYQRIQRKARAAVLTNDFRVFGTVFQSYAHEKGSWPAETAAGVVPAGITDNDLQINAWTKPTAMGGQFDWENNQAHPGGTSPGGRWRAALAITGTTNSPLMIDAALMKDIDELLDDGDLETGNFRKGFGDCPILIIEP
jgi:prepilin-type N-terminal cleavage/methylation domain-containing protein